MGNYDVISIVGMPRSGTTFLWRFLRLIYGLELPEEAPRNSSYLTLGENQAAGTLMSFGGNPWSYIRELLTMWRTLLGKTEQTLVYKHPQLVFFDPPPDLRVFTILCERVSFELWQESWLEHGGYGQIDPNVSPVAYMRANWPYADWGKPEIPMDRYRACFNAYQAAITRQAASGRDYCVWRFEQPDEGLENIFSALGLDRGHIPNVRPLFAPRRRR